MVEIGYGNLLEAKAEALVNTVNCVGVMGRGVALQFRQAFPSNYQAYKKACDNKEVRIGKMFVTDLARFANPKHIINFPTKKHWRGASKLEYIEEGLIDLVRVVKDCGIRSIAIPPLGCGLGGLKWSDVQPRIVDALGSINNLDILLFEPNEQPEPIRVVNHTEPPPMTSGRAVLLILMGRYLAGLMDPFVSLLEIHKLMYFMQEAGQPLKLKFNQAPYGPYAENLRHVLIKVDGHFIKGYGDGTDDPRRAIEIEDSALTLANDVFKAEAALQEKFDRVEKLIDGYETPFGMELLATVHWVVTRQQARDPLEATQKVHAWNDRKAMFSERHVRTAWESLARRDWIRHTA